MSNSGKVGWQCLRIAYRLGLYALILPFALYYGPNFFMFGKFTPLGLADFAPTVETQCVPTVRAIKEYQRDKNGLPDQLDQLVPKYLPSISFKEQIQGERYIYWDFEQDNSTIYYIFPPQQPEFRRDKNNKVYEFIPHAEEWQVEGYFVNGRIPYPIVTLEPATQPIHRPR